MTMLIPAMTVAEGAAHLYAQQPALGSRITCPCCGSTLASIGGVEPAHVLAHDAPQGFVCGMSNQRLDGRGVVAYDADGRLVPARPSWPLSIR